MAELKQFNPKDLVGSFGAVDFSGWMPGEFINATHNTDDYSLVTGPDGEAVRIRMNDDSGEVVLTFLQSSSVNDQLMVLRNLDKTNGTGKRTLSIEDLNGTTVIYAESAWIKKVADVVYGDTAQGRQWTIQCHELELSPGGNAT